VILGLTEAAAAILGSLIGGSMAILGGVAIERWRQHSERKDSLDASARVLHACGQAIVPLLQRAKAIGQRDEGQESVQIALAELTVALAPLLREGLVAHAHIQAGGATGDVWLASDAVAAHLKGFALGVPWFGAVHSAAIESFLNDLGELTAALRK
jgi:hypothetical protein